MSAAPICFEAVSKKFRRGERHDSLRDLLPAVGRRLLNPRAASELDEAEFWAVRDVSFHVSRGQALGIIGPNGAGKSTVLKLLTRILKPTTGSCRVSGRVGALIEVAAGFHPDLTGRENVYLQGAIMGMRRAEINRKFDDIVAFAGVDSFIDTPVKRYSSGMNARLGFAIAAHLEPDVLLIDEVLSVGDMQFQRRCLERMQSVCRQGAAVVFVSHDLAAIRTMCSSALLLKNGRPIIHGPTGSVLDEYVRLQQPSATATETDGLLTVSDVVLPPSRTAFALAPADRLSVRLRIAPDLPFERLVLVTDVIHEQTRTTAHNSNIPVPAVVRRQSDGSVALDVAMQLNLLRGVYTLNFSVYDPATQTHLQWLKPAFTFGIDEPTSYAGIAHLDVRVRQVGEPVRAQVALEAVS